MAVRCGFCGNETDFLSTKQAARLLDVSRAAIKKWCANGKLNGARKVKMGRRPVWQIPSTAVIPVVDRTTLKYERIYRNNLPNKKG